MSYIIISDGFDYKIAKILQSYKNHEQVELVCDKSHKKIKIENKLFTLTTTDITKFQQQIDENISDIDSEILWELIENPYEQKSIHDLATLYFNENYTELDYTSLLFHLARYNVRIKNYQNGYFSLYTAEEQEKQQQILLRKKQEEEAYNNYYNALLNNQNPAFNNVDIIKLLNRPDKNSIPYKVLLQRSHELNITPIELCCQVGIISDLPDFFVQSFMRENFSSGINHFVGQEKFQDVLNLDDRIFNDLVINNSLLKVFSIDDRSTTEIDDAFSVQELNDNTIVVGIHIAAPALNLQIAELVAENISTIYYPGKKITMLPDCIVEKYSLEEGRRVPVVSIYFTLDKELTITDYSSTVELLTVTANLRIEDLEILFNQENLEIFHGYPYENELKLLYRFANLLEEKRGKPSVNTLVLDYNFSFDENGKICIKPRVRGNPIDRLVSELMILANGTWGRMLTNAFIPAIYRVKQPNFPVKMTSTPASHVSLNVDYYTWATSPLRRASDYINQRQIIGLVRRDKQYFNALDPIFLEVVENFDTKYSKYLEFQNKMERYWSLAYLLQEQITEINAIFTYKNKVNLEGVPIELDLQGIATAKPQGSVIRLKIYNINLANLSFNYAILP